VLKGFTPEVRQTSVHGYGPWFPDHIPTSDGAQTLHCDGGADAFVD